MIKYGILILLEGDDYFMMADNGENNVKYMDRFYDSPFSSYDFLSLFSALYASEKDYSFSRDELIILIDICKKSGKYSHLVGDINLRNNGIHSYSEDLDEAVAKLKWAKILYTVSPEQDSRIYIFKDTPFTELMRDKEDFIDEMTDFIGEFKEYGMGKDKESQKRISHSSMKCSR